MLSIIRLSILSSQIAASRIIIAILRNKKLDFVCAMSTPGVLDAAAIEVQTARSTEWKTYDPEADALEYQKSARNRCVIVWGVSVCVAGGIIVPLSIYLSKHLRWT